MLVSETLIASLSCNSFWATVPSSRSTTKKHFRLIIDYQKIYKHSKLEQRYLMMIMLSKSYGNAGCLGGWIHLVAPITLVAYSGRRVGYLAV